MTTWVPTHGATAKGARPKDSAYPATRYGASSTVARPGADCPAPCWTYSDGISVRSYPRRGSSTATRRAWLSTVTRPSLPTRLRDTLTLLCATPLATVEELSSIGRVPNSTLRDRLARLTERGLVDSVQHRLSTLGPHATRRYFPTEKGIVAAGAAAGGLERLLETHPVSRQWLRLLAERLDAVAVLYHAAAMVADADPSGDPARVDHYRHGPYDLLITLSGSRTIGLIRHGPALPNANLRYRLRSKEHLGYSEEPLVTLVLTHSTQAMRRAIRSLGDPQEHGTTLVACERELLTGGAGAYAWQPCGTGRDDDPPDLISPDIRLAAIVRWSGRLVDRSDYTGWKRPTVDPESLYSPDLRATMPEPTEQLRSALAVQLTRAEKDALDLISAWPSVHPQTTRRPDGRSHPPPRRPGAAVSHASLPGAIGRTAPRPHGQGAGLPRTPRSRRRRTDPRPLEPRA